MCRWQPVEGRRALAYLRAKHGVEAFARVVVRQAHHDSPTLFRFRKILFLERGVV
jgi:hypothetical protein